MSTFASSTAPLVSSTTFSISVRAFCTARTTRPEVHDDRHGHRSLHDGGSECRSVTSVTSHSLTARFDERRVTKHCYLAIMNSALVGIDEANVSTWMSEHVKASLLTFELMLAVARI